LSDRTRAVQDLTHLELPFLEDGHRALAARARAWGADFFSSHDPAVDERAVDQTCRDLVAELGRAGFTAYCVRQRDGGALPDFDARSICVLRETLGWHHELADFALGMQGLGSGALSLFADEALRARYLPRVAKGEAIAAFALSEPEAGSDVAGMSCRATRDGPEYVLNGEKTWISNGGIADFYCVFARTSEAERRADGSKGAAGISAFVVEAENPGLTIAARIEMLSPHPLARLAFKDCRVPVSARIGGEGEGFKVAMQTLDVFRASVAAAAQGFARRALAEAITHVQSREMFGRHLADFQITQVALADMATGTEAAGLLTYRAAWLRDKGQGITRAAAMAKLSATENAQQVIDRALQAFGGQGVVHGAVVERLYRAIRALRIYEGATEVQKLIIGRDLLKSAARFRSD
jgi:alkylation response protein AidB-like acyl-CoA dehydrogenase